MRKLVARKCTPDLPLAWQHRAFQKPVFHEIVVKDTVRTDAGEMVCATLTQRADLQCPTVDVAALVGTVELPMGHRKPMVPIELYYWNDQFWIKGVDKLGVPYYHDKHYLLYPVQVHNPEALLGTLAV
jgi:hypothetical protein